LTNKGIVAIIKVLFYKLRYNFINLKRWILKSWKMLGFTLAEILITLGVIGIVAALTIPLLMTRIEEKVLINKLLEVNSQLTQASKLMIEEQGLINTYSDDVAERRGFFLSTCRNI